MVRSRSFIESESCDAKLHDYHLIYAKDYVLFYKIVAYLLQ